MTNSDILFFDTTFLNVEVQYEVDGIDYLYDLLASRSRLLKFISPIIGKKNLYSFVARIDFISSYLIVTIRAFQSLLRCIFSNKIETSPRTIGLLSCDLIVSRSKSADLFDSIESWLVLPYTIFTSDDIKKKQITVYNLITCKDVISSYLLSLKAICYSNSTNKNLYIRRLFVSFEFFVVKKALERLAVETKLIFANHKDRWALLYDGLPQKNKVLLQHGVESTIYRYPIKLKNITELFAFNQNSFRILMKTILDCNPTLFFLKPTIALIDSPSNDKFKILIVSPFAPLRKEEDYLIRNLQSDELEIYVKPHYQNKDYSFYESLAVNNHFILIKEQIFPKVDVVVSYESTLVVEYQMHNIEVLQYEYNTLGEIVNKIKELKNNGIH